MRNEHPSQKIPVTQYSLGKLYKASDTFLDKEKKAIELPVIAEIGGVRGESQNGF